MQRGADVYVVVQLDALLKLRYFYYFVEGILTLCESHACRTRKFSKNSKTKKLKSDDCSGLTRPSNMPAPVVAQLGSTAYM